MSTPDRNIHAAILAHGDRPRELELIFERLEVLGIRRTVVIANCVSQAVLDTIYSRKQKGNNAIELHHFHHNTGSAGGYSEAIRVAFGSPSCDAVWLLDDDNLPAHDCLEKLQEAYQSLADSTRTLLACVRPSLPEMQQIDPMLWQRYPSRGSCVGFNLINIFRRLHTGTPLEIAPNGLIPIVWRVYGGLLLPRSVFDGGELPMKSLHLYGDDMEWTARLTNHGFHIMLVRGAEICDLLPPWNAAGDTGSNLIRKIRYLDDSRVYFETRNRNWLALTLFKGSALLYSLNRFLYLTAALILAARYHRMHRFKILRQAIRDAERSELGNSFPDKLIVK